MTDPERSATPEDGAPDSEVGDASDEFEDEEFDDDDLGDLDDDELVDDIDDELVEDELVEDDEDELVADELVDDAVAEDLEVEFDVEPLEAVDDGRDDDDTDDDDEDDDEPEGNRQVAPVASAVLTHIAASLVDDPDAVHLSTSELRGRKVRLSLRVAPNDLGRLIGRRGRVAASIRTVVGAAATRDGIDVEVEFAE